MYITKNVFWPLLFASQIMFANPTQAEIRFSGQPCFDNAVKKAAAGEDLRVIMQQHIDITSIAASAAWIKWRIHWKNLDERRQMKAINSVHKAIAKASRGFFENIDLSTLTSRSKPSSYGHLVWGSYRNFNGQLTNFELGVRMPLCKLVRVTISDISLSVYIANRL